MQTIDDVHEDISLEGHNPTKKRKMLLVFGDMIADMETNKKVKPVVTDCT